jgi:hypothetical protein
MDNDQEQNFNIIQDDEERLPNTLKDLSYEQNKDKGYI